MNSESYSELLFSVAFLLNLDEHDSETLQSTGGMYLNEVYFYLLHEEDSESDDLFLYCIFGELPAELEAQAMRALLQENSGLFPLKGPSFMISPHDGNVMLATRYSSIPSAEDLLGIMQSISEEALNWRQTYYLGEESVPAERPETYLNVNFV